MLTATCISLRWVDVLHKFPGLVDGRHFSILAGDADIAHRRSGVARYEDRAGWTWRIQILSRSLLRSELVFTVTTGPFRTAPDRSFDYLSDFMIHSGRFRTRPDYDLVPLAGIEPALLAELDFESSASTNSATGARSGHLECHPARSNLLRSGEGSARTQCWPRDIMRD